MLEICNGFYIRVNSLQMQDITLKAEHFCKNYFFAEHKYHLYKAQIIIGEH